MADDNQEIAALLAQQMDASAEAFCNPAVSMDEATINIMRTTGLSGAEAGRQLREALSNLVQPRMSQIELTPDQQISRLETMSGWNKPGWANPNTAPLEYD